MAKLLPLLIALVVIGIEAPSVAETALEESDDLASLARQTLADRAERWICVPTSWGTCNATKCERGTPTIDAILIDFESMTYGRCGNYSTKKDCEHDSMSAHTGGVYTRVVTGGGGNLVLNDGSEFVDVVVVGNGVAANFGTCEPADLPSSLRSE